MLITTWLYIKLVIRYFVLYLQHDKDNDTFACVGNDSARLHGI